MKIAEAFERVNNFGVFQMLALPLLAVSGVFHGMNTASNNFITGQPERWCKIERLQNFSFDQQRHITIPFDAEGEYDNCQMFGLPWDSFTDEELLGLNRTITENTAESVPCEEFVFSKATFSETAVSKWGLACSDSLLAELMPTFFTIGLFMGSLSSGRISDSFGRKPSFFGYSLILMACIFSAAFVPNAIAFLILRFFIGLSMRGSNISVTVLMMEISGPKQRELAGVLTPGSFSIGAMLCAAFAVSVRDFQLLHIAMGGIAIWLIFMILLIPESPKWSLVKGKVEQAEKTMKWIGEVNGRPLDDDFQLTYQKESRSENKKQEYSYLDLYKYPTLRKHVLIMHYLWVAANFSYIALSLNIGSLFGDAYLNVFLSGVTELPAQIMVLFTIRFLGRRNGFLIFGVAFALFNAVAIPLELIEDARFGASISTILARASASSLVSICQLLTAELFPTPVRQSTLGACLGLAAAFSTSGSYLGGSLRNIFRPLPNIIYGSLGVIAVVLVMFLPETKGHGLPDTIEEAINTGRRKPKLSTSSSLSDNIAKQKAENIKGTTEENGTYTNAAFTKVAFTNGAFTNDIITDNIEMNSPNEVGLDNGTAVKNEVLSDEEDSIELYDATIVAHF